MLTTTEIVWMQMCGLPNLKAARTDRQEVVVQCTASISEAAVIAYTAFLASLKFSLPGLG